MALCSKHRHLKTYQLATLGLWLRGLQIQRSSTGCIFSSSHTLAAYRYTRRTLCSGYSAVWRWCWSRRSRKRWSEDGLFLPERVGGGSTKSVSNIDIRTTTIPSVCGHTTSRTCRRRQRRPTQPFQSQGRAAPAEYDAAFLRGAICASWTRLHHRSVWQGTVHAQCRISWSALACVLLQSSGPYAIVTVT